MEKNNTHINTTARDHIGMNVPEGYFDTFHDEIMQEIESPKSEAKVRRLPLRQWMAYAASVALLVGAYVFMQDDIDGQTVVAEEQYVAYEELTAEEFYDELELDFDDYEIDID